MLGLRQFGGPVISSGLNKKLRPDRDEPLKLKDGHLELPKISTTKEQAAQLPQSIRVGFAPTSVIADWVGGGASTSPSYASITTRP